MKGKKQDKWYYYHLLGGPEFKGSTLLAEEAVIEAYQNQVRLANEEYEKVRKVQDIKNISFVRVSPRNGDGLLRRKGFVIGFKEIYAGNKGESMKGLYVGDKDEYRRFHYAKPSEDPLGYIVGISIKFPEDKKSIVIDSKKTVPINSKNLEGKLKDIGLNSFHVKRSITKYNKEKREKEVIYEIFFNYKISEKEIEQIRVTPKKDLKKKLREGIGKVLEDAVNHIVNFELE
jgi:hypothetical protein